MTEEQRRYLKVELERLSCMVNDSTLHSSKRLDAQGRWEGIHYAIDVLGLSLKGRIDEYDGRGINQRA